MDVPITHLKLQKILYYVAGAFAGALNERAFWDSIEAWEYGPVVRNVYIEYCSWGALLLVYKEEVSLDYDDEKKALVDFVIDQKIRMSGRELVNATRSEAPWKKYMNCITTKPEISYQDLRNYFVNSNEVKQWNLRASHRANSQAYFNLFNLNNYKNNTFTER